MTGSAAPVAKPISCRFDVPIELLDGVTLRTLELKVPALQRISSVLLVVEITDLEALRTMAVVASPHGLTETELSGVRIFVAALAVSWNAAIARSLARASVLLGRRMARDASRLGVSTRPGPGGVIDAGRVPAYGRMAVSTATLAHLGRELIAVIALVTVLTPAVLNPKVESWPLLAVAPGTGHCEMSLLEGEGGRRVLIDAKSRWEEPRFLVALAALPSIS